MDMEKIGKFLKELRTEKGLSQNKMGEQIHVTRQAISNWENGKSIPESDMLKILSKYFKVSIDDILSGERVKEKNHLEKTTLAILDEMIKKTSKFKRIMIFTSLSIIVLLFLIFGLYFFTNYNSIKVYTISGETQKYSVKEGLAISTKGKSYIRIGQPIQNTLDDNKNLKSFELYYTNTNNKVIKLYKKNELEEIVLKYDFKNKKEQKEVLKKLKLKFVYEDNSKEIMNLKLDEDFTNDFNINTKNDGKVKVLKEQVELNQMNYDYQEIFEEQEATTNTPVIIEEVPPKEIIESTPIPVDNSKVEIVEEKPVEVTEEVIQEEPINYEEVIQLVKQYGVLQNGKYLMEMFDENTYINISYFNDRLFVDISFDNVIESWQLNIISNNISYQKYENFIEIINKEIINDDYNTEENQLIIEDMNHYIRLFLKKMKEGN